MRKLLTLTAAAAFAAVMGMSGSAWAGPLEPTSYDMLNGETGSFPYHDEIYSGAGSPMVNLSPLSGGLGDLTDDVFAPSNWFITEPPAGNGPYVGWKSIDPTITFDFGGPEAFFDTVTIHVDDSNGAGGVSVPSKVEITVGGNSTQVFPIVEPGGSAPLTFAFDVGGEVGDTVVVQVFRKTQWIMVSEVDFDGALAIDIDIKFCSNPNGFNSRRTKGVVPVTIFGTTDFDVTDINISTVMLCNEALTMCAGPPVDSSIADRGDPETDIGASQCAIEASVEQDFLNQDGFDDLDVAFDVAEVCTVIDCDTLGKGDTSDPLVIKGELLDGTEFLSINTDVLDIKR